MGLTIYSRLTLLIAAKLKWFRIANNAYLTGLKENSFDHRNVKIKINFKTPFLLYKWKYKCLLFYYFKNYLKPFILFYINAHK